MREILYVQAGPLANYIGTHYWNTQESYFTYEESEEPLTLHDISFREGGTSKGELSFCPRLLLFDYKAAFGTLAKHNALFGTGDGEEHSDVEHSLWSGDSVEYRQNTIPKSRYQVLLDAEEPEGYQESSKTVTSPGDNISPLGDEVVPLNDFTEDVRFWSDFNRVYYIPRTLQQIPDAADWEDTDGDWSRAQQTFARYNEETGLMEDPVRLFLEECDFLQGIHIMTDTSTFGGFMESFLACFRDESVKAPALVWPLLSGAVSSDDAGLRKAINDALYLRSVNELGSMSIPIQSPSSWEPAAWSPFVNARQHDIYHSSAILSSHIETSTLPLRLKRTPENLSSFMGQLNWRGTTPSGQLNGILHVSGTATDISSSLIDFTNLVEFRDKGDPTIYARRDVTRGFDNLSLFDDWSENSRFALRTHAPAYPLPASFPTFPLGKNNLIRRPGVLATTPVLSSIAISTSTAALFASYARLVEQCLRRVSSTDVIPGVDRDEMKELANDLWTLHDGYVDDEYVVDDEGDSRGEDED